MKVEINGFDPHSSANIKYIGVWTDLNRKKCNGIVRHGDKVYLLGRNEDDCLIKAKRYIRIPFIGYIKAWFKPCIKGYVKYWFIKQFKLEYMVEVEKNENT